MCKNFLGSVITIQKFLFCMCLVVCSELCSMGSLSDYVMGTIITHNTDHSMDRILAMVSKLCNKTIEDYYRLDKKRIESWMQEKKVAIIPTHASWNKDFTQCSWIRTKPSFLRKKMQLTVLGVLDKNIIMRKKVWDDYVCSAIEESECPFFDEEENRACCYGYGYITNPYHNPDSDYLFLNHTCERRIIEYSLSLNGQSKRKSCFLVLGKDNNLYNLSDLLNFPVLLKAILKSTSGYESVVNTEVLQIYTLSLRPIPDDYRLYKKCLSLDSLDYESYGQLPDRLRTKVEKQHQEQQRTKTMFHKQ